MSPNGQQSLHHNLCVFSWLPVRGALGEMRTGLYSTAPNFSIISHPIPTVSASPNHRGMVLDCRYQQV